MSYGLRNLLVKLTRLNRNLAVASGQRAHNRLYDDKITCGELCKLIDEARDKVDSVFPDARRKR
jgi:hypothetical protein